MEVGIATSFQAEVSSMAEETTAARACAAKSSNLLTSGIQHVLQAGSV